MTQYFNITAVKLKTGTETRIIPNNIPKPQTRIITETTRSKTFLLAVVANAYIPKSQQTQAGGSTQGWSQPGLGVLGQPELCNPDPDSPT